MWIQNRVNLLFLLFAGKFVPVNLNDFTVTYEKLKNKFCKLKKKYLWKYELNASLTFWLICHLKESKCHSLEDLNNIKLSSKKSYVGTLFLVSKVVRQCENFSFLNDIFLRKKIKIKNMTCQRLSSCLKGWRAWKFKHKNVDHLTFRKIWFHLWIKINNFLWNHPQLSGDEGVVGR